MPNVAPVIDCDLRSALVAMVKRRVPESEVEDIVQATLADAFASPHAPNDAESFRRWIFGVAKNKVVDYHRRAGRETFDLPEDVQGEAAPHQEADLLRWAERNLPPGEENKKTLDWMLREGDGEKLEWIAENDNVPAPRVRQRVSRLRRHLKEHWQKEVAVLAALGVLMTALFVYLNHKKEEPIANEDPARAEQLRKDGLDQCAKALWQNCVQKLDDAKKLDPAGDSRPEIQRARDSANKALTLPPAPSSDPTTTDLTPIPVPTVESSATPPSKSKAFPKKPRPVSTESLTPFPMDTSTSAPMSSNTPSPPMKTAPARKKSGSNKVDSLGGGSGGTSDFASKDFPGK